MDKLHALPDAVLKALGRLCESFPLGVSEVQFFKLLLQFSPTTPLQDILELWQTLCGVNGSSVLTLRHFMSCLALTPTPSPYSADDSGQQAVRLVEREGAATSTPHGMRITEARYVPQLNAFFTLEEGQSRVTVYRASPRDPLDANSGFEVLGHMEGEATVFGFEYIEALNVAVLAQGNFTLRFWDCRPALERGGNEAKERSRARAAAEAAKAAAAAAAEQEEEKEEEKKGGEEKEEGEEGKEGGEAGEGQRSSGAGTTKTAAPPAPSRGVLGPKVKDLSTLRREPLLTLPTSTHTFPHCPLPIISFHLSRNQRHVAYLPHTGTLITGGVEPGLLVFDLLGTRIGFDHWKLKVKLVGELPTASSTTVLRSLPTLGVVVSGGGDGELRVWGEVGAGDGWGGARGLDSLIPTHPYTVVAGARAPAGAPALGAGKPPTTCRAGPMFLLSHCPPRAHPGGIRAMAFSPGTRQLFTVGFEPYTQVYDLGTEGALHGASPRYLLGGGGVAPSTVAICGVECMEEQLGGGAGGASGAWDQVAAGLVGGESECKAALAARRRDSPHFAHLLTIGELGEMTWWDVSRLPQGLTQEARRLQCIAPKSTLVASSADLPSKARGLVVVRSSTPAATAAAAESAAALAATTPPAPGTAATISGCVLEASREGDPATGGLLVITLANPINLFEVTSVESTRCVPRGAAWGDDGSTGGGSLVVVSEREIRVFDGVSGEVKRVFLGALPEPVTGGGGCFALVPSFNAPFPSAAAHTTATGDTATGSSDSGSDMGVGVGVSGVYGGGGPMKALVGCSNGSLLALCPSSGLLLKAYPRHYGEVTGVVAVVEDGIVVSAGGDGRVHVSDDRMEGLNGRRRGLIRRVKQAHGKGSGAASVGGDGGRGVTALAVDHTLSFIATAGGAVAEGREGGSVPNPPHNSDTGVGSPAIPTPGTLRVWDYQDLNLVADIPAGKGGHTPATAPITALAWLSPYSVLVAGDAGGVMSVWGINRGGSPPICLATLHHTPCPDSAIATAAAAAAAASSSHGASGLPALQALDALVSTTMNKRLKDTLAAAAAAAQVDSLHGGFKHHHHHSSSVAEVQPFSIFSLPPPTSSSTSALSLSKPLVDNAFSSALTPLPSVLLSPTTWGPAALATSHFPPLTPSQVSHTIGHLVRMTCVPPPLPPHHYSPTGEVSAPREPAGVTSFLVLPSKASLARVPLRSPLDAMPLGREVGEGVADDFSSGTPDFPILVVGDASGRVSFYDTVLPLSKLEVTLLEPLHSPATLDLQPSAVGVEGEVPLSITTPPTPTEGGEGKGVEEEYIPYTSLLSLPSSILQPELSPRDTSADHHQQQSTLPSFFNSSAPSLHASATNAIGEPKEVEEGQQHKQNQPRFLARIRPVLFSSSSPTSHLGGKATGTSAGAFAGVAGFPPVYTLRRSQEPLDPSKVLPLHQGYNPRKTVKLVGREPWVHRPLGKGEEEEEEVTLEGTQVNNSNTSASTISSSNFSSVISSGPFSFPVPSSSKSATVGPTSTTPSTSAATHYSVSVLAQITGQLWHPTVVRNVHGLHHQRAVGAPPQWRGFPVASLSFSRTPGFTGIVSSGEDGTVRVLSVGERGEGGGAGPEAAPPSPALGSLLGSLSVAVGRKSGGNGGDGGEGGQVAPPMSKSPSVNPTAKVEEQEVGEEQEEQEEQEVNEAQLTGDFWGPFVDVGARARACHASMAALRARLGEKAWEVGKLDFLNDNRVKLQYQGKGGVGGVEGGSAAKGGGVGGKGDAPLSFAHIRDDALRQLKFIAASATPAPPPLATEPASSSSSTSSSTPIATTAGGPTSSLEIVPPLELFKQLITLGRESSERSLPPTLAAAAAASSSSAPPLGAPAPSPAAIKRLGIVESLTARSTRGRGVGGFDQYNIKSRLTLRNEEEDDTSEALSAMVMEVPSAAGSTAAQGGLTTTTTTSSTTPSSPSLSAQHRERESAMERIRALAFSGSMRPEACVVKIGGVGMVDPVASARILSTLEREKRAYPSYFAEAAKGLGVGGGGGGGKPSSSPNTPTSSKSPSGGGAGAGGGGGAHSQRLSPFLAANLHRLEGGATGGGGGKIKLTSPHSSRKPITTPTPTTTTTTLPSLPLNLPASSKLLHQTPISPQQRHQQGARKLTINTAANLSYSAAPPTSSSAASTTTPASPSPNVPHSLSFSSSSSSSSSMSNILLNPTVMKSLPSEFRGLLLSPLASVGGGKGGFSVPSGGRLGAAGGDSGSDGESGEEGGDETRVDGGKIPLDLAQERLRGASVPLDLLGDTSSTWGGGKKEGGGGGEGEELGRGGFGTKKIQPSSAKLILQRALGDAYGSLRNAPAVDGAAGAGSEGVGGGGFASVRSVSPPPVGLSPPRSPTPASFSTRRGGGAASPTSNGSSAALRLADFESRSDLTPEEYAQLFNQHSVCGVKKKELADLLFLLHAVDEDRNGKLDMNEWLNFNSNFTKRVGVNKDTVKTKEELMKIMGDMDVDKSGFLTLEEVLRAMYPKKSLLERKVLRAFLCYSGPTEVAMAASAAQQGAFTRETLEAVRDLFRLFDVDDSQTVSMEEMERLLGDSLGDLGGNSVTAKRRRREVVMEVCAGLPTIQGGPFHGHLSFEAFLQLMGPVMEMEGRMLPL